MSRPFSEIINEWTDSLLKINRTTNDPQVIALVTRLGMLGQRLIYESNRAGMQQTLDMNRQLHEEAVCKDIDTVLEGMQ